MQTKLAHVSLTDITVSETNKIFRDEAELTDTALKELIESIKTNGVISPVMLTPRPGDTKYMLVCGERRFRAAGFAGLKTIPCNIRELTDDQVLDVQLIENLERKDVHPSKEAKAYRMLMDKHPELSIADLALKFAKTEQYILVRLKLNDLVPEAMEDFARDVMTIGQAVVIARLTPPDQKLLLKQCTETIGSGKQKTRYYQPVAELKDFIEESVICNLSAAAFKKDDASLLPEAGSCTTCPKRSGANQLFSDVNEDDRCFDRACYQAKRMKFLVTQIPAMLEDEPDLCYFSQDKKIDPEVEKILHANKVKIMFKGTDFSNYDWSNDKAKITGIWINGDAVGTKVQMYSEHIKRKKIKPGDDGKLNTKVAIENIKQRTKRAAELDQEKIYVRVIEALQKSEAFTKVSKTKATKTDDVMVTFMILEHSGYGLRDKIRKIFKLPNSFEAGKSYTDEYIKALEKLSEADKLAIARITMLDHFAGQATNVRSTAGKLLIRAAREYAGVDVDLFEREQKAIADKREARAKERIAELQQKKKVSKSGTTVKKNGTAVKKSGTAVKKSGLAKLIKA